jgi:hypothetical protein
MRQLFLSTVAGVFVCHACLVAAVAAETGALQCPALYPAGVVKFTGLNPAIERKRALSNFASGEVVEIDPLTMPEAEGRQFIADLQALGARVSIYLVGGHCVFGWASDCNDLAGVRLGPTGSWNWDKEEKRILDITHPLVIERLRKGAETGWRLGANYIRVDNLHYPAGATDERTAEQMKVVFDALHKVEDQLRRERVIPPDRSTGVVAHNNLEIWEKLIRSGQLKRPPVLLTSERTGQLAFKGQGYKGDTLLKAGSLKPEDVGEIAAGSRIARALGVPYTIVEFAVSHDLGGQPGKTYDLPPAYVDQLARVSGVTEVVVMPSEANYVGRGQVIAGDGPRHLPLTSHPANAGKIAMTCMQQKASRAAAR